MAKRRIKPVTKTFSKNRRDRLRKLIEELEAKPGVAVRSICDGGIDSNQIKGGPPKKYGATKARYYPGVSGQTYRGINRYYREYRRNFLVRKAIESLAYWCVKEGFDTFLEPGPNQEGFDSEEARENFLNQYLWVKNYVDEINYNVNMDQTLRVAVVKMKIYGRAAFEVEFQHGGRPWTSKPLRLIPLDPEQVKPEIDSGWSLTGFTYQGQKGFYRPDEIVYFVNSDIEGDMEGLSDVEPILKEAELDDKILREDLAEAASTLWAGIAVHTLQTDKLPEGVTQEQVQKIIDEHIAELKPGKHVATTDQWQIQIVDIKPDLDQLLNIIEKVERRIVGNFQVPRFMLNIEKELNRATAYAELEAFIEGPVTDIQRILKRTLEAQWYPKLVKQALKINGDNPPVTVKHIWRQIRTADWFELVRAVSQAYDGGKGWVDRKKIYEMMRDGTAARFDPSEVQ
ncbi:phage portal protein [Candidatus Bathyarchaeota archaeon]|nr:phage portal protein [Candidatus Bathyarchaeota archaeon]